jgi:small nuclear ribonucleoprotein
LTKPLQVLQNALGKTVGVELRGQVSYQGILDGFDPHMNLVLRNAKESAGGKETASHETAILRGDGVIYIST